MLYFNLHPSVNDKYSLIRMLKKDISTCYIISDNMEDNCIASIYDDNILCGGALVFREDNPVYLFCFFEQAIYCTDLYQQQLKRAIEMVLPKTELYDVYCINATS